MRSRDYAYMGCFKDAGDDRILGKMKVDDNLSTEVRQPASVEQLRTYVSVYFSRL